MSNNKFSAIFFSMIAEMDLVVKNFINIFFISRYLGSDGASAYEIIMPYVMVSSAFVAMGYNGVQTMCAKDYGAGNRADFTKHKNAGYSWLLVMLSALTLLFFIFRSPILDLLGANDGSRVLSELCSECYDMFLLCLIPQVIFSIACSLMFFEEKKCLGVANIILYTIIISGCILVSIINPSMTLYIAINVAAVISADLYIILYCFIYKRKTSLCAMTVFRLSFSDFKEILFTGLPDFMEYGYVAIFYLIENLYVLSRFSQSVLAGAAVFEAIDNFPEIICVGFCFLVNSSLGIKVGEYIRASSENELNTAEKNLEKSSRQLIHIAVIISLAVCIILLIIAKPVTNLFLTDNNPVAVKSSILLTVSCALGFIFYMLNSGLICYYKIVKAYAFAHIALLMESLLLPLGFRLLFGELFGITGFCLGGILGEIFTLFINLCVIRIVVGHFPYKMKDFRLDKYLHMLKLKQEKMK